jgi:hypothetical protein
LRRATAGPLTFLIGPDGRIIARATCVATNWPRRSPGAGKVIAVN